MRNPRQEDLPENQKDFPHMSDKSMSSGSVNRYKLIKPTPPKALYWYFRTAEVLGLNVKFKVQTETHDKTSSNAKHAKGRSEMSNTLVQDKVGWCEREAVQLMHEVVIECGGGKNDHFDMLCSIFSPCTGWPTQITCHWSNPASRHW